VLLVVIGCAGFGPLLGGGWQFLRWWGVGCIRCCRSVFVVAVLVVPLPWFQDLLSWGSFFPPTVCVTVCVLCFVLLFVFFVAGYFWEVVVGWWCSLVQSVCACFCWMQVQ